MRVIMERCAILPLCLSLVLLIASGCLNPGDQGLDEDLLGILWRVDSVQIADVWIVPDYEAAYTIRFLDDWQVSGDSPCNSFTGEYFITTHGSLTISELSNTSDTCFGWNLEEGAFYQALSEVTGYARDGTDLELFGGDEHDQLRLSAALVDEDLVDLIWRADSLRTPDSLITVEPDIRLTLLLNGKTEALGKAAVNQFGGLFTNRGTGSLTVQIMYITEMICWTPRLCFLEGSFLSAIDNIATYSMDETGLQLYSNDLSYEVFFSVDTTLGPNPW